jgi:hypothetical protein
LLERVFPVILVGCRKDCSGFDELVAPRAFGPVLVWIWAGVIAGEWVDKVGETGYFTRLLQKQHQAI